MGHGDFSRVRAMIETGMQRNSLCLSKQRQPTEFHLRREVSWDKPRDTLPGAIEGFFVF